jgi:hypothetical protein
VLEGLTPDPANPVGYRAHLYSVAKVNDVARSYVEEGVECYVSSFYRAAAVMTGAAAESIILELRDLLLDKLKGLGRNSPKDLDDWRIKRILDAMHGFFSSQKASLGAELGRSLRPIGLLSLNRYAPCATKPAILQALIKSRQTQCMHRYSSFQN